MNYCGVLTNWEHFIKMRAAFHAPSSLELWRKERQLSYWWTTLICIENWGRFKEIQLLLSKTTAIWQILTGCAAIADVFFKSGSHDTISGAMAPPVDAFLISGCFVGSPPSWVSQEVTLDKPGSFKRRPVFDFLFQVEFCRSCCWARPGWNCAMGGWKDSLKIGRCSPVTNYYWKNPLK